MLSRRTLLKAAALTVGAVALGAPAFEPRTERFEYRVVARMGEHRMIRRVRVG